MEYHIENSGRRRQRKRNNDLVRRLRKEVSRLRETESQYQYGYSDKDSVCGAVEQCSRDEWCYETAETPILGKQNNQPLINQRKKYSHPRNEKKVNKDLEQLKTLLLELREEFRVVAANKDKKDHFDQIECNQNSCVSNFSKNQYPSRELEREIPISPTRSPNNNGRSKTAISRTDSMAHRSRHRRFRKSKEKQEYEEYRRNKHLRRQEEAYRRRKRRKERKEAELQAKRMERLQQLQNEYQKEWDKQLSMVIQRSSLRSRPCIEKIIATNFEDNEYGNQTTSEALDQQGIIRVNLKESYIEYKFRETEVNSSSFVLRGALLPWGDTKIIPLNNQNSPVLAETQTMEFKYRGMPPSRVIPAIRFELHKKQQILTQNTTPKNGSRKKQVATLMIGAAEHYITKYLNEPCLKIDTQIALSNGAGILKLELVFENPIINGQFHGTKFHPLDFQPRSRLSYCFEGTLRIRIIEAELKEDNWDDLRIVLSLLPWGNQISASTKPVYSANSKLKWSKSEGTLDLRYTGAPPKGMVPMLHLQVINRNQHIGSSNLSLATVMQYNYETVDARADVDLNGRSIGAVFLNMAFAPAVQNITYLENCRNKDFRPRPPSPLFTRVVPRENSGHNNLFINRSQTVTSPCHSVVSSEYPTFSREHPSEEELKILSQCGTLKIRAIAGYDLKKVQMFGKQDPYVKVTLLPWKETSRCKTHVNGGVSPQWTEKLSEIDTTMVLSYPGAPTNGDWPILRVQIFDEESVMKDRLIGWTDFDLFNFLSATTRHKEIKETVRLNLIDKKKQPAGQVVLSLGWNITIDLVSSQLHTYDSSTSESGHINHAEILPPSNFQRQVLSLTGLLLVRAVSGTGLRNVQNIGKQDPYVKVKLLPWGETTKSKCHTNGGKHPKWTRETGEMILSYPGAPPEGKLPCLLIEVFDAESVMKDRFIGQGEVQLYPFMEKHFYRKKNGYLETFEEGVEVHLKEKNGKGAGLLEINLGWKCVNEAAYTMNSDDSKHEVDGVRVFRDECPEANLRTKGKITLQVVQATNLKVVQSIGKQDPYVEVKLLPCGNKENIGRTKTRWSAGENPTWDEESGRIELDYPGWENKAGLDMKMPCLEIKVMDAERIMKDREIGRGEFDLCNVITSVLHNKNSSSLRNIVQLYDKNGKNAGGVSFTISFIPDKLIQEKPNSDELTLESLRYSRDAKEILEKTGDMFVRVISADNLKVVQKIGIQDPYVRVQLTPWGVTGKCKTKWDGGGTPRWSEEEGRVRLQFGGGLPEKIEMPTLKFQVLNDFKVLHDREIGSTDFKLNRYFTEEDSDVKEKLFEIPLFDAEENDAGILKFALSFKPENDTNTTQLQSPREQLPYKEDILNLDVTLHARAICAKGLKSVHYFSNQNPYVKLTALKSGNTAKTKPSRKGGKNPRWNENDHESKLRLLAPANDHNILIEVLDSAAVMRDKIIGTATIDLNEIEENVREHEIELSDAKGDPTGTILIEFYYEKIKDQHGPDTWVYVHVEQASNLIRDQSETIPVVSPYCQIFLEGNPDLIISTDIESQDENQVFKEIKTDRLWTKDGVISSLRGEKLVVLVKDRVTDAVLGFTAVNLQQAPLRPFSKAADFIKQSLRWYNLENPENAEDEKSDIRGAMIRMSVLLIRRDGANVSDEEYAATKIQAILRGLASRRNSNNDISSQQSLLHDLDSKALSALARAQDENHRYGLAATNIQRVARGRRTRALTQLRKTVNATRLIQRMFRRRREYLKTHIKKGTLTIHIKRAWNLQKGTWVGKQDPYVKLTLEPGHIEQSTKACRDGGVNPEWNPDKHDSVKVFQIGEHPLQTENGGPIRLNISLMVKKTFQTDKEIGCCELQQDIFDLVRYYDPVASDNVKGVHSLITNSKTSEAAGMLEVFLSWKPKYFTSPAAFTSLHKPDSPQKHSILSADTMDIIKGEEQKAKKRLAGFKNEASIHKQQPYSLNRDRLDQSSTDDIEQIHEMAAEEEKRARAMKRLALGQQHIQTKFSNLSEQENEEIINATTSIQRIARGKLSRKRSIGLRMKVKSKKEAQQNEYKASRSIQRIYRGRLARKKCAIAIATAAEQTGSNFKFSTGNLQESDEFVNDAADLSSDENCNLNEDNADLVTVKILRPLVVNNEVGGRLENPHLKILLRPGSDTCITPNIDGLSLENQKYFHLMLPRERGPMEWPSLEFTLITNNKVISVSDHLMIASMKAAAVGREVIENIEFYNDKEEEFASVRVSILVNLQE